jgi:hypothetical protein
MLTFKEIIQYKVKDLKKNMGNSNKKKFVWIVDPKYSKLAKCKLKSGKSKHKNSQIQLIDVN